MVHTSIEIRFKMYFVKAYNGLYNPNKYPCSVWESLCVFPWMLVWQRDLQSYMNLSFLPHYWVKVKIQSLSLALRSSYRPEIAMTGAHLRTRTQRHAEQAFLSYIMHFHPAISRPGVFSRDSYTMRAIYFNLNTIKPLSA